jgi:hypothetical protein
MNLQLQDEDGTASGMPQTRPGRAGVIIMMMIMMAAAAASRWP